MELKHPEMNHAGMIQLQEMLKEANIPFEYTNILNYGGKYILYYPSMKSEGPSVMAQPEGRNRLGFQYFLYMDGLTEPGAYSHAANGGMEEFDLTPEQVFERIKFDWSFRQILKQVEDLSEKMKKLEQQVDILTPSVIERQRWD